MSRSRLALRALSVVAFSLAFAPLARAQAPRTWVSGVGDDVNPCSRTAPCKTFAGAISKTAAGGEIDALDPGGFGGVTITKSITIDGGGGFASILVSGTNAINIAAGKNDAVTIRNLSLDGIGTGLIGIRITGSGAGKVYVEHCLIFGFQAGSGRGISDERNDNTAGVRQLYVKDTIIKNNLGVGIVVNPASTPFTSGTLNNVQVVNNGGGGVLVKGGHIVVGNSNISGNGVFGLQADVSGGIGTFLVVDGTEVHANVGTGVSAVAGTVVLTNAVITDNSAGVAGIGVQTFQNNKLAGNGGGGGDNLPAGSTGLLVK